MRMRYENMKMRCAAEAIKQPSNQETVKGFKVSIGKFKVAGSQNKVFHHPSIHPYIHTRTSGRSQKKDQFLSEEGLVRY